MRDQLLYSMVHCIRAGGDDDGFGVRVGLGDRKLDKARFSRVPTIERRVGVLRRASCRLLRNEKDGKSRPLSAFVTTGLTTMLTGALNGRLVIFRL
jgi:hypothetical protein